MIDIIQTYQKKKSKGEFLDIDQEFDFIENLLEVANEAVIRSTVNSDAYKNAIAIKNYFGDIHYSLSGKIEMKRREEKKREVKAAWYQINKKTNS